MSHVGPPGQSWVVGRISVWGGGRLVLVGVLRQQLPQKCALPFASFWVSLATTKSCISRELSVPFSSELGHSSEDDPPPPPL